MLMVDARKRFTIDQCLSHPWLNQTTPNVNDSTDGLVGGIADLAVKRRAPPRERTLLASINTTSVEKHLPVGTDKTKVKVFSNSQGRVINVPKEQIPAHYRAPEEFMGLGGKGDQQLYGDDGPSSPSGKAAAKAKAKNRK